MSPPTKLRPRPLAHLYDDPRPPALSFTPPPSSSSSSTERFSKSLEMLRQFVADEGRMPSKYSSERSERQLHSWVTGRKREYARGDLTPEQIGGLESISKWRWQPQKSTPSPGDTDKSFDQMLESLKSFLGETEGHMPSRKAQGKQEKRLAQWVWKKCKEKSIGSLSPEKVSLCESIANWKWN